MVDFIWKSAAGFEGIYSVSSCGQVRRDAPTRGFGSRSRVGAFMKQKKCADGYRSVSLYPKEGKQKQIHVHRLVAIAFYGAPPEGKVVNHKDGNKANNSLSNLEYVTPSENTKHAYATGLARGKKGESNPMAVLNADTAAAIRLLGDEHGWSIAALARAFRTDTCRVRRILNGTIWRPEPSISAW